MISKKKFTEKQQQAWNAMKNITGGDNGNNKNNNNRGSTVATADNNGNVNSTGGAATNIGSASCSVIHLRSPVPLHDAKAIQEILPNKYVLEKEEEEEEESGVNNAPVMLLDTSSGNNNSSSPILMFMPSTESTLQENKEEKENRGVYVNNSNNDNMVVDATIVLKHDTELQSCIRLLAENDRSSGRNSDDVGTRCTLLLSRSIQVSAPSSLIIMKFIIVRLPGKSNIFLTTSDVTSTINGRLALLRTISNLNNLHSPTFAPSLLRKEDGATDEGGGGGGGGGGGENKKNQDKKTKKVMIPHLQESCNSSRECGVEMLIDNTNNHEEGSFPATIQAPPVPPPPASPPTVMPQQPPPKFPSLSCKVLQQQQQKRKQSNDRNNGVDGGDTNNPASNGTDRNDDFRESYKRVTINSRKGIPIETDLFVGKMVLILRPTNVDDDPYYNDKIFSKKRRRFILQIQGKFKRKPRGVLYAGNEITDPMKLGLVTKGLASVLLKLMSSFYSSVHFSFGDEKEKSHIVIPAVQFFDDIIVTNPDDEDEMASLPKLGDMVAESKESKARRKSGVLDNNDKSNFFDTAGIYTLSFHSMYFDLPTWHIRSVPALSDLDLRTFWNDSGLRMVMYEIDNTASASTNNSAGRGGRNNKHYFQSNLYYFVLQTEFLGSHATSNDATSNDDDDDDDGGSEERETEADNNDEDDILPWGHEKSSLRRGVSLANVAMYNNGRKTGILSIEQDERSKETERSGFSQEEEDGDDDDEDDDGSDERYDYDAETVFFDAEHTMESVDEFGFSLYEYDDDHSIVTTESTFSSPIAAMRSTLSNNISAYVDVLCPAWIDIFTSKGRYTTVYAFNSLKGDETWFRTPSQFMTYFNTARAARSILRTLSCSPRLSSSEKKRRIIGRTYAKALLLTNPPKDVASSIQTFQGTQIFDLGATFLQEPTSTHPTVARSSGSDTIRAYACVARATSEHRWVEEWATITDRRISFYSPTKSKCRFSLSIQNVVVVRTLDDDEKPHFPLYYFLAIETIGRTVYLMFKFETTRNEWFDLLIDLQSKKRLSNVDESSSSQLQADCLLSVDNPSEEFLHKSSDWTLKNRRIINCRKFNFTSGQRRQEDGEIRKKSKLDPLSMVEGALRIIQRYTSSSSSMEDLTETDLCAFLDCVSILKEVDVVNDLKNEQEKMTFFLNLYHCMTIHAYLVVGTPRSAFQWMNYFNMVSYQCSDDVFSLAELEHCVIRSAMNYPSQFVSKVVLPQSKYKFAMNTADYRINFALICGSKSAPNIVPIYNVQFLDEQLDNACSSYLQSTVEVRGKSRSSTIIRLPRVCCWFADDFGSGSNSDIVCAIEKFLGEYARTTLRAAYSESKQRYPSSDLTVKYFNYSFECQNLVLTDDLGSDYDA